MSRGFWVPEEFIHRDIQGHGDPPQRARMRRTSFPIFDLIDSRSRNLGTAGELIGAPPLEVTEISNTLTQGRHLSYPHC